MYGGRINFTNEVELYSGRINSVKYRMKLIKTKIYTHGCWLNKAL